MTKPNQDSAAYLDKRKKLNKLLTIYGRNSVLECLQDDALNIEKVHLADSNRSAKVIDDITLLCQQRHIEIAYHDKKALSRISKNAKQDQGVCADIALPRAQNLDDLVSQPLDASDRFLLLDGVNNPQNLGMIIRSVAASSFRALILPDKANASINPLTIKASAGAIFKCPLVRCHDRQTFIDTATQYRASKGELDIAVMRADARQTIYDYQPTAPSVYVLGNETEGVSKAISDIANTAIKIPMQNDVESLNVAVTAGILAFVVKTLA